MKKFGTPIGAEPGRAIVKVGLSSVGVPSTLRPGLALSTFFFVFSASWTSASVAGSVALCLVVFCRLESGDPDWAAG